MIFAMWGQYRRLGSSCPEMSVRGLSAREPTYRVPTVARLSALAGLPLPGPGHLRHLNVLHRFWWFVEATYVDGNA